MKRIALSTLLITALLTAKSQDFSDQALDGLILEFQLEDSSSSNDMMNRIMDLDIEENEKARYLLALGRKLILAYQYDLADDILEKCLELTNDTSIIAAANFDIGVSLSTRDIKKQALRFFNLALENYTAINDSSGIGRSLDKIADNHNYFGEHTTARPYYDRAIEIFENIQDTAALSNVLGNIGGMFSDDGIQDSAMYYYKKSIFLNEVQGNLPNLSHDLAGIGMALEELNQPNEALNYFRKAYEAAYKSKQEEAIAFANQHLGYYYFNMGVYDSSLYYMGITYQYAQKMNYGQLLVNSLDILHQASYQLGNYKAAYDIYSDATQLNDSLLSLENVSLINALRSEYEIAKQSAENIALINEADLQEQFLQKQIRLNVMLIIGTVLLLIAIIGLISLNRNRKKKNEIIREDRDLINEQKAKLQELDQVKSTFFANLAHDYRAPIMLVKGFADLIKINQPQLTEESKEYIDQIQQTADRLSKMTEEINELIQLEDNRYQLKPEQINLNEFFGTIAKMYQLGRKQMNLDFEYVSNIPDGHMMHADRSALEKITFNVLGNAFKYNNTGTKVGLHLSLEQNELKMMVTDDGPGISEDKIDKIFERYYRTEKGSETAMGLGIGLALAKDLITLHNGDITVSSIPDQETCFTITLPMNNDHL